MPNKGPKHSGEGMTTLEDGRYLSHSRGQPEGKTNYLYFVERADVLGTTPLKSFNLPQNEQRLRAQVAPMVRTFAIQCGKTLSPEELKGGIDTLLQKLGLESQQKVVTADEIKPIATEIIERLLRWKPDQRAPKLTPKLYFILSEKADEFPDLQKPARQCMRDASLLLKDSREILNYPLVPVGSGGNEDHGIEVHLRPEEVAALGDTKDQQVTVLAQQIAAVINGFTSGDFFSGPPERPMHVQIAFSETVIEDQRPPDAPASR